MRGGIAPYGPQETLDVLYEQLLLVADDENLPQDRAAYDELVAYEKSLKIEKKTSQTDCIRRLILAEHTV